MRFLAGVHSDVGIKKKTNQDSLCLKIAETVCGTVLLAVVCDGMGGLTKGELASASVVRTFSNWFEQELPEILSVKADMQIIKKRWADIIQKANINICEFGTKNHISLGTTLTALLIIDGKCLITQIGDTRLYKITKKDIIQLTKDQTVVAMEVEKKQLTQEQARQDPRRNVLLQCIGASKILEPVFTEENAELQEVYLLCSDGFRHKLSEEEMLGILSPDILPNEAIIKKNLVDLVEINKTRKEQDNISVLLIKTL